MKALTDEGLQDYLDEDLSWRRAEIQVLKAAVSEAARFKGSPKARATSRALAVMTYAHWEGYVKSSFDKLAETIMRRKPTLNSVADPFAVAHLKHLLLRLSSGDPGAQTDLLDLARQSGSPRLRLRREELVRTHDNLRFRYFMEILDAFGMSGTPFELRKNFIDASLCDRRNSVAHGRDSFPDADSVIKGADEVIAMIEVVKDLQLALLSDRAYLRQE